MRNKWPTCRNKSRPKNLLILLNRVDRVKSLLEYCKGVQINTRIHLHHRFNKVSIEKWLSFQRIWMNRIMRKFLGKETLGLWNNRIVTSLLRMNIVQLTIKLPKTSVRMIIIFKDKKCVCRQMRGMKRYSLLSTIEYAWDARRMIWLLLISVNSKRWTK